MQRMGFMDEIKLPEHLKIYLDVVRDADRLESIGKEAIDEMKRLLKADGVPDPEAIIKFCKDDLLRIYEEDFIVTKKGREMALPKHQYMLDYFA